MGTIAIKNYSGTEYVLGYGTYAKCLLTEGKQKMALMGDDVIEFTVVSDKVLPITLGAMTICYGRPYFLNYPAKVKKNSSYNYVYTYTMEGVYSLLKRVLFFNSVREEIQFDLVGTPDDFFTVMEYNYNRAGDSRVLMQFVNTDQVVYGETKHITFSDDNCLTALQKICDAYGMRYSFRTVINGATITVFVDIRYNAESRIYTEKPVLGNGLSGISITPEGNRIYGNRIYPFGSDRNIPVDYRGYSKLLRPLGADYIENAQMVASQGVYEVVTHVDSIYPRREGSVTALPSTMTSEVFITTEAGSTTARMCSPNNKFNVGDALSGNPYIHAGTTIVSVGEETFEMLDAATVTASNIHTVITSTSYGCVFEDSTMNFDLNATNQYGTVYLVNGLAAKITFNSGNLAGYSFALKSYDHSHKRFEIIPVTDERGLTMPEASTFFVTVGDKYVITDIRLPDAYITTAEQELSSYIQSTALANFATQNQIAEISIDGNAYRRMLASLAGLTYKKKTDANYPNSTVYPRDINSIFDVGFLISIGETGIPYYELQVLGFERDMINAYDFTKVNLGINKYTNILLETIRKQKRLVDTQFSNPSLKRESSTMLNYNQK